MKQKPYVKVYATGTKWSVKTQGTKRRVKICDTLAEAIQIGRRIAMNRGCELRVHRVDGTMRSIDSFGKDPFPPLDFRKFRGTNDQQDS